MTCTVGESATSERPPVAAVCSRTADLLSCQLCPSSPTFWRNTPRPPTPTDALDGGLPVVDDAPDRWAGTLDWSKNGLTPARSEPDYRNGGWKSWPCVMCGNPTITRTFGKDLPTHKVCAEKWYAEHPHVPLPPVGKSKTRQGEGGGTVATRDDQRHESDLFSADMADLDALVNE